MRNCNNTNNLYLYGILTWKIDQRFFSLRTGSLPSRTLIKPSPFSQAPKEFSFPPSSLKSDSTLGRLMKWLCHEEDAEGLSSQTPQIPSSSVRLIYSTIRLRPVCPLWPSLVWGWNQHLRIGSSQSCMFVKRWPTRDSLLWDMTLEHTSGIDQSYRNDFVAGNSAVRVLQLELDEP